MTNQKRGGGEKKSNLKYTFRATDKSSFFLIEPWRSSELGVNGYWEPKNGLQRDGCEAEARASEGRAV